MDKVEAMGFRRELIQQRELLYIGKSYPGCVRNEQEVLFNIKSIFKNVRKMEKLLEDKKRLT